VALARVRIQDSQIHTAAAQVGIDLQAGATIQLGGFILDKVRFSNAGIPIQGINGDDNRADFQDCTGGNVINSATISEYYMVNNVTATTITDANFVKVAGTTTNGLYIQRFTNTNNRATYTGTVTQFFTVSAIVSANAGNNQLLIMRIAKNGVTIAASEMQATTSGNGRSESIKCQTVVLLSQNDYIEVFIANSTAPTNITATELNVIIQAA
jgi:hypothetical protein